MKAVLFILAAAALVGTILPAGLYLASTTSKSTMQWWMLAATVVWFVVVPFCRRQVRRADRQSAAGSE